MITRKHAHIYKYAHTSLSMSVPWWHNIRPFALWQIHVIVKGRFENILVGYILIYLLTKSRTRARNTATRSVLLIGNLAQYKEDNHRCFGSANTEYWIENEKATLVSSELWSWWLYESINEVVNENLQTRKAIISCGCFVKYLTNQTLKHHCSNLKSCWFDIQKGVLN